MQKAKWIWTAGENGKDTYGEFSERFAVTRPEKVFLRIACDGIYAAYLNGALVAFSQCADFPWYKLYDEVDVTEHCCAENTLKIVVWHLGDNTQTYIDDTAGVLFEVVQDGAVAAYSGEHTPSRTMNEYKNGYGKKITTQLGYSFLYDNTVPPAAYGKSVAVQKSETVHRRAIQPLCMQERLPVTYTKGQNTVTADMQKEVAGFAELSFYSPVRQKITFCYGEHVQDGCVRRKIDDRDFSFELVAREGENAYLNPLRRIAGRFIEAHCEHPIEVRYMGIRPVTYPVREIPFACKDELWQRIYDTCVYTLRCCMHEHYEDCPWREQALYTLDSRNQMLCGYYAFEGGNRAYVRHNLVLISKSLRPDGLLSICAPSGTDIPIPFFSLAYILQTCEYVRHTGDNTILAEVGEVLQKIVQTFGEKMHPNGLIPAFPLPYWNFYEWAEESDGAFYSDRNASRGVGYDLILNCMYVYVLGLYGELTGKSFDVRPTVDAIYKTFYKDGVFVLSTATQKYSQLGNAFALLVGLGDERLAERIRTDENMIPATLSMKAFVYDALLSQGEAYRAYVLSDIRETYGKMLAAGATTFWETEKGEADFGGAGSLCHGWSAMPIYYLHVCAPDTKTL